MGNCWKGCKKFSLPLFVGSLFGMSDKPYEVKLQVTLTTFIVFVGSLVALVYTIGVPLLTGMFNGWESLLAADWAYWSVCGGDGVFSIVNFVSLVLFKFHKNIRVLYMIFYVTGMLLLIPMHFLLGAGFGSAAVFFIYFLNFLFFVVDTGFWVVMVFFSILFCLALHIYDIVVLPEVNDLRFSYILIYGAFSSCFFVVYISTFIKSVEVKKNNKFLMSITEAIASLDVENNENVQKLKVMDASKCTTILNQFKEICEIIGLYKSYLPASLYDSVIMDQVEEGKAEKGGNDPNPTLMSDGNDSETASRTMSRTSSTRSSIRARTAKQSCFLIQKEVTVICLQFTGMSDSDEMMELPSATVFGKGILSLRSGKILITFNAIGKCLNHEREAVKCISSIRRLKLNAIVKYCKDNVFSSSFSQYSAIVCSEKALCGNVGYEKYKTHEIIGKPLEMSQKIVDYMRENKYFDRILIEKKIMELVKWEFKTKIFDQFDMPNSKNKGVILYTLGDRGGKNQKKNQEWMYKISHSLDNVKSLSGFEDAWDEYLEGDFVKSLASLQSYRRDHDDPDSLVLLSKLKKSI